LHLLPPADPTVACELVLCAQKSPQSPLQITADKSEVGIDVAGTHGPCLCFTCVQMRSILTTTVGLWQLFSRVFIRTCCEWTTYYYFNCGSYSHESSSALVANGQPTTTSTVAAILTSLHPHLLRMDNLLLLQLWQLFS
jgi:hypothetical protein